MSHDDIINTNYDISNILQLQYSQEVSSRAAESLSINFQRSDSQLWYRAVYRFTPT